MILNVVAARQNEKTTQLVVDTRAGRVSGRWVLAGGFTHHALVERWVDGEGWKFVGDFWGTCDAAADWLTTTIIGLSA